MNRLFAGTILACLATLAVAGRAEDEAVFDKNKGRIFALYARELKDHPGLEGRTVLELKIGTDGRVTNCRIVSSNVPSPGFNDQLCERVRQFQFAPRPAATTFTKEITVFPAA